MYWEITGIKAFEILDWSFKLILLFGISLLIVCLVLWIGEMKKRSAVGKNQENS